MCEQEELQGKPEGAQPAPHIRPGWLRSLLPKRRAPPCLGDLAGGVLQRHDKGPRPQRQAVRLLEHSALVHRDQLSLCARGGAGAAGERPWPRSHPMGHRQGHGLTGLAGQDAKGSIHVVIRESLLGQAHHHCRHGRSRGGQQAEVQAEGRGQRAELCAGGILARRLACSPPNDASPAPRALPGSTHRSWGCLWAPPQSLGAPWGAAAGRGTGGAPPAGAAWR